MPCRGERGHHVRQSLVVRPVRQVRPLVDDHVLQRQPEIDPLGGTRIMRSSQRGGAVDVMGSPPVRKSTGSGVELVDGGLDVFDGAQEQVGLLGKYWRMTP